MLRKTLREAGLNLEDWRRQESCKDCSRIIRHYEAKENQKLRVPQLWYTQLFNLTYFIREKHSNKQRQPSTVK